LPDGDCRRGASQARRHKARRTAAAYPLRQQRSGAPPPPCRGRLEDGHRRGHGSVKHRASQSYLANTGGNGRTTGRSGGDIARLCVPHRRRCDEETFAFAHHRLGTTVCRRRALMFIAQLSFGH
jgi:hypothetical protein